IRFVLQRSIGPIADPGQRFAALLYFLQPNRGHVLLQTGLFLRRALLDTVLHGDGLSGGLETVAEKTAKVFGPLLPWFICAIRPPGPPGGGWSFFRFLAICRLPIAGQPGWISSSQISRQDLRCVCSRTLRVTFRCWAMLSRAERSCRLMRVSP